jgi:hypothetical protein
VSIDKAAPEYGGTNDSAASESTTYVFLFIFSPICSSVYSITTDPTHNAVSIDKAAPEYGGTNDSGDKDVTMKDITPTYVHYYHSF